VDAVATETLTAEVVAPGATLCGLTLQVAPLGAPAQDKVTVLEKSLPSGLTFRV